MAARLRVGVVGGGLIAQAVHLPRLAELSDRFELVSVADPSATVRDALAARYSCAAHEDWRSVIDDGSLDAVLVCSPHATHAEIALAALDAGIHVFVEKPLCISVDDADAICRRRDERGLVVQVGYMKRFDAGYGSLLASLPADASGLRMIDVVTYDPWMAREPFVRARDLVPANDIPDAARHAVGESERQQVGDAIGRDDPESVRAFSYTYLACLVHDVNLVLGVLDRLGFDGAINALTSRHWADGKAAAATFELAGGVVWNSAWMLLEGLDEFNERASFYFENEVQRLRFPSPYLTQQPTTHERVHMTGRQVAKTRAERVHDAYRAELEHFHDCIVAGVECLSTPEDGRRDIALLRDAFVAGHPSPISAREGS